MNCISLYHGGPRCYTALPVHMWNCIMADLGVIPLSRCTCGTVLWRTQVLYRSPAVHAPSQCPSSTPGRQGDGPHLMGVTSRNISSKALLAPPPMLTVVCFYRTRVQSSQGFTPSVAPFYSRLISRVVGCSIRVGQTRCLPESAGSVHLRS